MVNCIHRLSASISPDRRILDYGLSLLADSLPCQVSERGRCPQIMLDVYAPLDRSTSITKATINPNPTRIPTNPFLLSLSTSSRAFSHCVPQASKSPRSTTNSSLFPAFVFFNKSFVCCEVMLDLGERSLTTLSPFGFGTNRCPFFRRGGTTMLIPSGRRVRSAHRGRARRGAFVEWFACASRSTTGTDICVDGKMRLECVAGSADRAGGILSNFGDRHDRYA